MNDLVKRIQEINKDLIIRKATQRDALGFTSLMVKGYHRKKNSNYFLWRYFSCPTPSELYVITTKRNSIIGAYGINIFTLENGKKCGLTVDLIVSDKYSKKGLVFLLEDKISNFAKKNNCMYLLALPNTQGMQAHKQIGGWQSLGTIPTLVLYPSRMETSHHFQITNKLNQKNIGFEYNKSLLNWRFIKNPENKYLHIKLGKSQAYIKTFFDRNKNIMFGDIVYYSSSCRKTEFFTIIDKAIHKLRIMKAQKIITWCNEKSLYYPIFLSLGFVPENQPRYLCIKQLSKNAANPYLLNWQLLPADSERF